MAPIDLSRAMCDLRGREVAMARGRKVRPGEAGALLREWEVSGQPMSRWCEDRGLNWYSLSAFKGWGVRGELAFAEVVEVEEDAAHETVAVSRARYRVEVGAVTIEVGDDFEAETLQRLVRAVAAC